MDLVVDQVQQLEDVHVPDSDAGVDRLATATVEHQRLAGRVDQLVAVAVGPCVRQQRLELGLLGAVEHRRREPLITCRVEQVVTPASLIEPVRLDSNCQPREATQPRCVSSTCPTFMRLGTPSGLSTMSTGVPSARNGMSSTGRILAITPLLPCRPASLSPSEILRFCATYTRPAR